jgi:hypothetical protein
MKKLIKLTLVISILASATSSYANRERRNYPKETIVGRKLEEAGAEHYPEKFKLSKGGYFKWEDTFYHMWVMEPKVDRRKDDDEESEPESLYRFLIFDNYENYLGYYPSNEEYGDAEEGVFLVGSNSENYSRIEFTKDGPPLKTSIAGRIVRFVKAPEKKAEAANADGTDSGPAFEYREWTITIKNQERKIRAVFVKFEDRKVFLQFEADGKTRSFDPTILSTDDQRYLQTVIPK